MSETLRDRIAAACREVDRQIAGVDEISAEACYVLLADAVGAEITITVRSGR